MSSTEAFVVSSWQGAFNVILPHLCDIIEGCQGKTCDFYEICVADGKGKGQCKCPDHCPKVTMKNSSIKSIIIIVINRQLIIFNLIGQILLRIKELSVSLPLSCYFELI